VTTLRSRLKFRGGFKVCLLRRSDAKTRSALVTRREPKLKLLKSTNYAVKGTHGGEARTVATEKHTVIVTNEAIARMPSASSRAACP
jgi:molybdenum cofactor biosynthesis enzyme MoaA